MVAGLLAFALVPLIAMSRGGIGRTDHAMRRIVAVNLANRMVARYASVPYAPLKELLTNPGFDPEFDPLLSPPSLPDSLREKLKDYTKEVRFREVIEDALGVIEVEVRWQPKAGAGEAVLKASQVVMNPY